MATPLLETTILCITQNVITIKQTVYNNVTELSVDSVRLLALSIEHEHIWIDDTVGSCKDQGLTTETEHT